jgi:uncharacterized protein YbjQ (UPF0145 family)
VPWFFGKSDEEKQREADQKRALEAENARKQASLAALEAGGIPYEAERRLKDVRLQEGSFFTSDLSVNEFLLARETRLRPLAQVTGSSVYHVGWRFLDWYTPTGELSVVSEAINQARTRALNRLAQEASLVGAHVVAGVRATMQRYEWSNGLIEFNFVGTAMRFEELAPPKRAALTNLSGQDIWKLYEAGYWPVGVVAGSSVYHVRPSWNQQIGSSWMSWANQELTDFTAGLYAARHLATRHLHEGGARLGAWGVVGMTIEQEEEEIEVSGGNDQERTDMIFTFHSIGTAIVERTDGVMPAVRLAVDLRQESNARRRAAIR